jgi:hypothetical protein
MPIRGSLSDLANREGSAGTRAVLDHHLLTQPRREPRGEETGGDIGAAAWRKRDDDPHGAVRPGRRLLGKGLVRRQQCRGGHPARQQQASPLDLFDHDEFSTDVRRRRHAEGPAHNSRRAIVVQVAPGDKSTSRLE